MALPSCRPSPSSSRKRCASSAERTVIGRLLTAAAAALIATPAGACSGGGPTQTLPPARIDSVDGPIEPIIARGERFVIEGFGFGTAPGKVRFPRIGGGTVDVTVADSDWTSFTIATAVPDSAIAGRTSLTVATAGGVSLSAVIHILPPPSFNPSTFTWTARTPYPGAPAGVALAAAEFPDATGLRATLYTAGGAEPMQMTPDSGVYVAHTIVAGAGRIGNWARPRDVPHATPPPPPPAPPAFSAAAGGTPYNPPFSRA